MKLLRTKIKDFQSIHSLDHTWAEGPVAIVGGTASSKSTTMRAVQWCDFGSFTYPDVKITKDMVTPDEGIRLSSGESFAKKGSSKEATIVQNYYEIERIRADGKGTEKARFLVTRSQTGSKSFLSVSEEGTDFVLFDDQAQQQIFSLHRIPAVGSPRERVALALRQTWLGVGVTSFFKMQPGERRELLEKIRPFAKLGQFEAKTKAEISVAQKKLRDLEDSVIGIRTNISAMREELSARIPEGVVKNGEIEDAVLDYVTEMEGKLEGGDLRSIDEKISVLRKRREQLFTASSVLRSVSSMENETSALNAEAERSKVSAAEEEDLALLEKIISECGRIETDLRATEAKKEVLAAQLATVDNERASLKRDSDNLDDVKRRVASAKCDAEKIVAIGGGVPPASRTSTLPELEAVLAGLRRLTGTGDLEQLLDKLKTEISSDEQTALIQQLRNEVESAVKDETSLREIHLELSAIGQKTVAVQSELETVLIPRISALDEGVGQARTLSGEITNIAETCVVITELLGDGVENLGVKKLSDFGDTFRTTHAAALSHELKSKFGDGVSVTNAESVVDCLDKLAAEVEAAAMSVANIGSDLDSLKNAARTKYSEMTKLTVERDTKAAEVARLKRLASVDGGSCDECGQDLSGEHFEEHKRKLKVQIETSEKDLTALADSVKNASEEHATMTLKVVGCEEALAAARSGQSKTLSVKNALAKHAACFLQSAGFVSLERMEALIQLDEQIARFTNEKASVEARIQEKKTLLDSAVIRSGELCASAKLVCGRYDEKLSVDNPANLRDALVSIADKKEAALARARALESEVARARQILADMVEAAHNLLSITSDDGQSIISTSESTIKARGESVAAKGDDLTAQVDMLSEAARTLSLSRDEAMPKGESLGSLQSKRDDFARVLRLRHDESLKILARIEVLRSQIESQKTTVEKDLLEMDAVSLDQIAARVEVEERTLYQLRANAERLDELKRMANSVRANLTPLRLSIEAIEETSDRLGVLETHKTLLQPSGVTRTLAMTADMEFIVQRTNQILKDRTFSRNFSVELVTEHDESEKPVAGIKFRVDGSSGNPLPSTSQTNIVGFATEAALDELAQRTGLRLIDEPEAGMDDASKPEVIKMIVSSFSQPIIATNSASINLQNVLHVKKAIQESPSLTPESFGVEFKTKATNVKRGTRTTREDTSEEQISEDMDSGVAAAR